MHQQRQQQQQQQRGRSAIPALDDCLSGTSGVSTTVGLLNPLGWRRLLLLVRRLPSSPALDAFAVTIVVVTVDAVTAKCSSLTRKAGD